MTLLEAVSDALLEVIKWPGMVYTEFCDSIGISEWSIIGLAVTVILAIIGKKLIK